MHFQIKSKVLWYFVIVYVFESVEYFVYGTPLAGETFHESPADTLINDIVMATIGLFAAIVYTNIPDFSVRIIQDSVTVYCSMIYALLHIILLVVLCLLSTYVDQLYSSNTLQYITYTVSYTIIVVLFINIRWAIFSAFCFFFISVGATDVYQRDFMYVPIVNLIVVPIMTIIAYLWYKNNYSLCCIKNETWKQRNNRFKTLP